MIVLGGCYGVDTTEASWEPIETITGILTPEVGPPCDERAPVDVLRIATWNVEYSPDPERLVREYFESPELSKADVLLIQETEIHPEEITSRANRMATALRMTWVFTPARSKPWVYGTAIMSRYPITNVRVMRLPAADDPINDIPRNAVAATILVGDLAVEVVDIHMDVRLGPVDRIKQLHPAATQTPERLAFGGDFNTNPFAWLGSTVPLTSTEAIVGQDQATVIDDYMTGLGFVSPIPPHESTFNVAPLDYMRLDNIFVRGYPVLAKGIAKDVEGSDHWPVWVDLAIR